MSGTSLITSHPVSWRLGQRARSVSRDTACEANQGCPASCDATAAELWHMKVARKARGTRVTPLPNYVSQV